MWELNGEGLEEGAKRVLVLVNVRLGLGEMLTKKVGRLLYSHNR